MTTQLTPPPAAPEAPAAPAPQSDTTRTATRALAITIAVLGAGALVLSAIFTVLGTVRQATRPGPVTHTIAQTAGITGIDVRLSAGELDIEFAGSEITLAATGSGDWRLERAGDRVVVASPREPFDASFSWLWRDKDRSATLILPESMAGTDIDLTMEAGRVLAEGEFGDVTFDMSAGLLELEGSATTLGADLRAGHALVELDGVREADVRLAAGYFSGQLTGEAPRRVEIDVSAGAVDLALPDATYAIEADTDMGEFNTHNLATASGSRHVIEVSLAVGQVDLRADD